MRTFTRFPGRSAPELPGAIHPLGALGAAEQRKHPRVLATGVAAHLCIDHESTPCTVHNISEGGLMVVTDYALPDGMSVAVNLARPGWSRVLRLTGRVVGGQFPKSGARGVQPGLRIRFDPLSPEANRHLVMLMTELVGPHTGTAAAPGGSSGRASFDFPLRGRHDPADGGWAEARTLDDPSLDVTAPEVPAPIPLDTPVAAAAPERSRLITQIKGLLMELGDLKARLDEKERQVDQLTASLAATETQLRQAEKDRRAAELAIQRLSLQLANNRR